MQKKHCRKLVNFNYMHRYELSEKIETITNKFNLMQMTGRNVEDVIFYTGILPANNSYTDNKEVFVKSNFFKTKEINCKTQLNNIENKNNNNKHINGYNASDLIWAHTYNHDESVRDIIYQCAGIAEHINASNQLRIPIVYCLYSFATYYFEGKNELSEITKMLEMNSNKTAINTLKLLKNDYS